MDTKFKVIWTDRALSHLENIYLFLFEKSETSAKRITIKLLNRTKQLSLFPQSGPIMSNLTLKVRYRYLVEGNYKIIYRIDKKTKSVFIARIFDTRQNPDKLNK